MTIKNSHDLYNCTCNIKDGSRRTEKGPKVLIMVIVTKLEWAGATEQCGSSASSSLLSSLSWWRKWLKRRDGGEAMAVKCQCDAGGSTGGGDGSSCSCGSVVLAVIVVVLVVVEVVA